MSDLRAAGVEHVVMPTGDNPGAAEAIAEATGGYEGYAGLPPADKVAKVEELVGKYGTVAMIGDGGDDAPATGRATVAVAAGALGIAATIETPDTALTSDALAKLPWPVPHSRRAL